MASRKRSGSKPKLTALAWKFCTSSSRPQPLAAMMREIHSGSLKVLPGGSIKVAMFSIAGIAPTIRAALSRLRAVFVDRGFGARRRRQMADLDLAGAHEREVIGPAFGRDRRPPVARAVPAAAFATSSAPASPRSMQCTCSATCCAIRLKPLPLRAVRREIVVGHHLEHVDAVERIEDAGGKLRPPAKPDAILCTSCRIRRTRLPHRRRSCCSRHCCTQELPLLAAGRGQTCAIAGNAVDGSMATPNRAVSHNRSRVSPPGRNEAARWRRLANRLCTLAR